MTMPRMDDPGDRTGPTVTHHGVGVQGFISETVFKEYLLTLRAEHRDFQDNDDAFHAIRAVLDDKSLSDQAVLTMVEHVMRESGH